MEKLYIGRKYNQWKGKDLDIEKDTIIEDEIEKNIYVVRIQIPDSNILEGNSKSIVVHLQSEDETRSYHPKAYVYDYKRKIIQIEMPVDVLTQDGLYKITITIPYNEMKDIETTAIQTFSIIDVIDCEDNIEEDENYPLLLQLIEEMKNTQIDLSQYATHEKVQEMIDANNLVISIETINNELNKRQYTTMENVSSWVSQNYLSKFDSDKFVTKQYLSLNYLQRDEFKIYMNDYVRGNELNNYVIKEEGKGLSTNDLTDDLMQKILDTSMNAEGMMNIFTGLLEEKANITDLNDTANMIYNQIQENKDEADNKFALKEDIIEISNITLDDIIWESEDYSSLKSLINQLSYKPLELTMMDIYPRETVYKIGTIVDNIKIDWGYNKNQIISQKLTGIDGLSINDRSATYRRPMSETTTLTLRVDDGMKIYEFDKTIKFVNPIYYGTFINKDTIGYQEELIIEKQDVKINMSYLDSYVYFAYPLSYGLLADIKDINGFSYITDEFEMSIISINEIDYYLYKTKTRASITDMQFTFIF